MTTDPTSQANYTQIASTHVDLSWTIDFVNKTISGSASHTLVAKVDGVHEVM